MVCIVIVYIMQRLRYDWLMHELEVCYDTIVIEPMACRCIYYFIKLSISISVQYIIKQNTDLN